jgi:hypothetical protein
VLEKDEVSGKCRTVHDKEPSVGVALWGNKIHLQNFGTPSRRWEADIYVALGETGAEAELPLHDVTLSQL